MPGLTRRILFRSLSFIVNCIDSFALWNKFFVDYALPIEEIHQRDLHTRLLKSQFFRSWRGFPDPCSGLTFSGRIVGKTPVDYVLFRKVKSHLKGRFFDSISDIQKAVTSTLNTIAKDGSYKGIQKLYDRANLCVQLEGKCVEN